jgi:beta-glucanase (GH16 family)
MANKLFEKIKYQIISFSWNTYLKFKLWYQMRFNKKKLYYFFRKSNQIEGWKLVFSEEFNTDSLNYNKWKTEAYYGLRFHPGPIIEDDLSPREYYSDDCIEFTGHSVKLKAIEKPISVRYEKKSWTIPYQIGQINSSIKFSQKGGYFEIKAKMPQSKGMWPAFWLASEDVWPPEIDVFEVYTGKKNGYTSFESNVHQINKKGKHKKSTSKHNVFNLSERPYLYGCEWDEEWIKFYFQGQLIRVIRTPDNFIHPMHVILNNSIDPNYVNEIEFPNYYEVFYFRAYKKIK